MNVTLFMIEKKVDATKKLFTICQKAFEKKIYLQIICPHQKTIDFLDKLLWESHPDAFLPHATDLSTDSSAETSAAPILLTTQLVLHKPFTHIIWLNKEAPPPELKWNHLYDFDDASIEAKARYHFYKETKCKVSLLS